MMRYVFIDKLGYLEKKSAKVPDDERITAATFYYDEEIVLTE